MFQRMKSLVSINVPGVDLGSVANIEVTFEQKSTGVEYTYSGDSIVVEDPHLLIVTVPREDAMLFDAKSIRGQVMFTRDSGVPDATKIFEVRVDELLKDDGYGD